MNSSSGNNLYRDPSNRRQLMLRCMGIPNVSTVEPINLVISDIHEYSDRCHVYVHLHDIPNVTMPFAKSKPHKNTKPLTGVYIENNMNEKKKIDTEFATKLLQKKTLQQQELLVTQKNEVEKFNQMYITLYQQRQKELSQTGEELNQKLLSDLFEEKNQIEKPYIDLTHEYTHKELQLKKEYDAQIKIINSKYKSSQSSFTGSRAFQDLENLHNTLYSEARSDEIKVLDQYIEGKLNSLKREYIPRIEELHTITLENISKSEKKEQMERARLKDKFDELSQQIQHDTQGEYNLKHGELQVKHLNEQKKMLSQQALMYADRQYDIYVMNQTCAMSIHTSHPYMIDFLGLNSLTFPDINVVVRDENIYIYVPDAVELDDEIIVFIAYAINDKNITSIHTNDDYTRPQHKMGPIFIEALRNAGVKGLPGAPDATYSAEYMCITKIATLYDSSKKERKALCSTRNMALDNQLDLFSNPANEDKKYSKTATKMKIDDDKQKYLKYKQKYLKLIKELYKKY